MFVIRAFIAGVFQVVYVYTPEAYPTELRASALGISTGISRVGAMLTSFVAIVLAQSSSAGAMAALGLYAASGLIAAVCAWCLPIETMGRELEDKVAETYLPRVIPERGVVSDLSLNV